MTPTMVNQQLLLLFFFTVKLDATNYFLSTTAEVPDIFIWKWATSWENLFLSYMNNKGTDQPAHPRSLISAFVVRCLDSNEILQLKAI